MPLPNMTLSGNPEGRVQGHSDLKALYLVKEPS